MTEPNWFSRTLGANRPARAGFVDPNLAMFQTSVPDFRPMDPAFSGGVAAWNILERQRLQDLGVAPTSRVQPGQPRGRLGTEFRSVLGSTGPGREFVQQYGRNPSLMETLRGDPSAFSSSVPEAPSRALPSRAGRVPGRVGEEDGARGDVDWDELLRLLGGQGGGGDVSVDRSLFQLAETPEEAAMLAREMAEIERRRAEGDVALRSTWGNVQTANTAAAERARAMAAQSGEAAAAVWSQAAQQARDLAAERARAAGQFEGRAAIDVDPEGGASDWVSFMESQAPAEQRFAERQQEILGSDLDWMAGMAGAQGEAFASDLRRQANVMSFERAREHNLRVQDRISQERMVLAQMEQQAAMTNAQLAAQRGATDPGARYAEILGSAAGSGNVELLARQLNISPQQAAREIENYWRATERAAALRRG